MNLQDYTLGPYILTRNIVLVDNNSSVCEKRMYLTWND